MIEDQRLIRPKDLARELCISPQTLWRWRRENRIPEPLFLGPRMRAWEVNVIEEWLKQQRENTEKSH